MELWLERWCLFNDCFLLRQGAYITAPVNSCEGNAFGENIIRGLLFFLALSSMLFCRKVCYLPAAGFMEKQNQKHLPPRRGDAEVIFYSAAGAINQLKGFPLRLRASAVQFFNWLPRSRVGAHTCCFTCNTIYYLLQYSYTFPRRAWERVSPYQ